MKGKLLLLAGAAVGYVFGTRAGRERYEEIKSRAMKAWNDPRVQEKVTEAEHFVNDTAKHKLPEIQERLSGGARGAMDKAKSKFSNGDEHGDEALTTSTGSTSSTPTSSTPTSSTPTSSTPTSSTPTSSTSASSTPKSTPASTPTSSTTGSR